MSTTMRCKLICHEITHVRHVGADKSDPLCDVRFGAVCAPHGVPADENAVFGKYTPVAEFKAKIVKSVADKLEPGKAYYLDFIPAD